MPREERRRNSSRLPKGNQNGLNTGQGLEGQGFQQVPLGTQFQGFPGKGGKPFRQGKKRFPGPIPPGKDSTRVQTRD